MAKDTQSRKYLLTINNPQEKDMSQEKIKEILEEGFQSLIYYCIADEVGGDENTYHTHLFLLFSSPVRFSTIKRAFSSSHIDKSRGTAIENRNYVFKQGKWKDTSKSETNLSETHFEYGEIPDIWKAFLRRINGVYELTERGFLPFDYTNFGGKRLLAQSTILLSREEVIQENFISIKKR
jgi:hypothetical protein